MSALSLTRLFVPAIAALALAACGGEGGGSTAASGAKVTPHVGDVVLGQASAPVEIVEYASLTCSHCRDFWKQDFPRLKAEYIDTGKVKFVLRDFPTQPAEIAIAAVGIARCKGPDNYYTIVDDVFTNQYDILTAAMEGAAGAKLAEIGARHGVSPEELRACVDDKRITKHIDDTVKEGSGRGVRSTPAVFVNGTRLDDHKYTALSAAIEKALDPNAPAPAATGETPATPPAPASPS